MSSFDRPDTWARPWTRSRCRSCHASIIWAKTEGRKMMPVDAEPVEDGNIELTATGNPWPMASPYPPAGFPRADLLYVSHYATCPDAEKWRK